MKFGLFASLAVWLRLIAAIATIPNRNYDEYNYFLVELDTSNSSLLLSRFIADHPHYNFEHQVHGIEDHFVFSIPANHLHNLMLGNLRSNPHTLIKRAPGLETAYDDLLANSDIKSIHLLPPKSIEKRMPIYFDLFPGHQTKRETPNAKETFDKIKTELNIKDPLFSKQWHLINTKFPGHDVNVAPLWLEGIAGKGIVTALVDDGLDYTSPDLADLFNAKGSWDFNANQALPLPQLYDDYHGTRCAGEIAATKNDYCGIGVAFDSQVSGIRILLGRLTSADEASAMVYGLDTNDIYSCLWGPRDDGKTLAEPDVIVKRAMVRGITDGRGGKGALYVFALGNGGRDGDTCNHDGYTNSIYSITVLAIDYKGEHPPYAESCLAVMVVTYSLGSGEHIHTTDFKHKCSDTHGGTSAAAPLAAGIYLLVLLANPELTWRDVQWVLVLSAVPVNEDNGDYRTTALGRLYSQKYGYGKIDAYEMVHFAQTWKNVKPQLWLYADQLEQSSPTAVGTGVALSQSVVVSENDMQVTNLERVEHVTVKLTINAGVRGSVGVRLISPHGMVSDLAKFRPVDAATSGFHDWTFMSVAHWGEPGIGEWKLEVMGSPDKPKTVNGDDNKIELVSWQLRLFGELRDASLARKYELSTDYARERRELLKNLPSPTKPEDQEGPATSAISSSGAPESGSPSPSSSLESSRPVPSYHDNSTEPVENDETNGASKSKVKATHFGEYFAGLAVLGFVVVLIMMKVLKTPGGSRRRRRREEYEFDIIPGEDYTDDSQSSGEEDNRRTSEDSFDLGHEADRIIQTSQESQNPFDDEHDLAPPYMDKARAFAVEDDDDDEHPLMGKSPTAAETQPTTSDRRPSELIIGGNLGESHGEDFIEDERLLPKSDT